MDELETLNLFDLKVMAKALKESDSTATVLTYETRAFVFKLCRPLTSTSPAPHTSIPNTMGARFKSEGDWTMIDTVPKI